MSEVSIYSIDNNIKDLTSLVFFLTYGKMQRFKSYGIYAYPEHSLDMCLTIQNESYE